MTKSWWRDKPLHKFHLSVIKTGEENIKGGTFIWGLPLYTFGSKYPLVYIVQENAKVPDDGYDTLTANEHYGVSWSMLE